MSKHSWMDIVEDGARIFRVNLLRCLLHSLGGRTSGRNGVGVLVVDYASSKLIVGNTTLPSRNAMSTSFTHS